MLVCCLVFFFFKQKTAYEMRISDWSSDVCSSDLILTAWRGFRQSFGDHAQMADRHAFGEQALQHAREDIERQQLRHQVLGELRRQIGRASCRERVCQYV